eukprot:gene21711-8392_t
MEPVNVTEGTPAPQDRLLTTQPIFLGSDSQRRHIKADATAMRRDVTNSSRGDSSIPEESATAEARLNATVTPAPLDNQETPMPTIPEYYDKERLVCQWEILRRGREISTLLLYKPIVPSDNGTYYVSIRAEIHSVNSHMAHAAATRVIGEGERVASGEQQQVVEQVDEKVMNIYE